MKTASRDALARGKPAGPVSFMGEDTPFEQARWSQRARSVVFEKSHHLVLKK
jgi:hypothetical protein